MGPTQRQQAGQSRAILDAIAVGTTVATFSAILGAIAVGTTMATFSAWGRAAHHQRPPMPAVHARPASRP
jgi:hypothetical protein